MTESNSYGSHNFSLVKVRVLYADTDKMGIVYHANYLRWFEAGRGSYMRNRALPYTITEAGGVQIPLTECGIRYHRPALYEQVINVKTWVTEISAVQIHFEYEISFEDTILVRGFTRHAAVNGNGRPTRVPQQLTNALQSIELETDESFIE